MQIRVEKPTGLPTVKRLNVAAYARVSVDSDCAVHSLTNQVDYYSSYIAQHPLWTFAGVYADEGITGTKAQRPAFKNLIRDCESGKIDMVLVKSISRFARNTVDLLNTTRHLKSLGVNIRFEKEQVDTMSAEGEFMLTMFASLAQEESRSISENMRWSIQKRFQKGIGTCFCLYGYSWDGEKFNIVPEQAAVIREIFDSYLKGDSPDMIANRLRERGLKTIRGTAFNYNQVCRILRLEKYTGDSILQKTYRQNHLTKLKMRNDGVLTQYMATETHPAIISHETFEMTQKEIARRAELGYLASRSLSFSCFTSKVICSECGKAYRRRTVRTKPSPQYCWKCSTKIESTASACNSRNIPEKALYEITADVLQTDTLSAELFSSRISRIEVSTNNTLTFHMTDGSTIERQWLVTTSNPDMRRRLNGTNSHADTGDKE